MFSCQGECISRDGEISQKGKRHSEAEAIGKRTDDDDEAAIFHPSPPQEVSGPFSAAEAATVVVAQHTMPAVYHVGGGGGSRAPPMEPKLIANLPRDSQYGTAGTFSQNSPLPVLVPKELSASSPSAFCCCCCCGIHSSCEEEEEDDAMHCWLSNNSSSRLNFLAEMRAFVCLISGGRWSEELSRGFSSQQQQRQQQQQQQQHFRDTAWGLSRLCGCDAVGRLSAQNHTSSRDAICMPQQQQQLPRRTSITRT